MQQSRQACCNCARRILERVCAQHGQHVSSERDWQPSSDHQRWLQQRRAAAAYRHDDDRSLLRRRHRAASGACVRAAAQQHVHVLRCRDAPALGNALADTMTRFEILSR